MAHEIAMTDYKCKYCGREIKEGFPMTTEPKKKGKDLFGPVNRYHPACYKHRKSKGKKKKYYYYSE